MEEQNKNIQHTDDELKVLMAKILANQQSPAPEMEEEEIDWMAYFQKIVKGWKLIAAVTVIFAFIGVGAALSQKRTYTVEVTLAPEAKGQGGSGALSGLVSLLGGGSSVNIGNSEDALNISLFSDIAKSAPFLTSLYGVQVSPYVSPKDILNGAQPVEPEALFPYLVQKMEKKSWLGQLLGKNDDGNYAKMYDDSKVDVSHLTPKQQMVLKSLEKAIKVEIDKKTTVTTISLTWDDPQIATQLADSVCKRLQEYVIDYRTKKARDDYEYYSRMSDEAKVKMLETQATYARSVDYDRSVILESVLGGQERKLTEFNMAQSIYQQRETQKEAAKAKCQEMKPVFAVIQPATFPERPDQSRSQTALAFMLVGLLLSGAWVVIGKDYYLQFKDQMKQTKAEA